jgi:hypothetical protein
VDHVKPGEKDPLFCVGLCLELGKPGWKTLFWNVLDRQSRVALNGIRCGGLADDVATFSCGW